MSLHFNWGRLDETCAEALRQLINARLAEVVARINQRHPAPPPPPPPPACSPTAAPPPQPQPPLPQGAAPAPAAAALSSALTGPPHLTVAGGHTATGRPEFSPNGSSTGGGSTHEPPAGSVGVPTTGTGGAAGAAGPRWETASDPSCSLTFTSITALHGAGAVPGPAHSGGGAAPSSVTGPAAGGPPGGNGTGAGGASRLLMVPEAGGVASSGGGGSGNAVSSETASCVSDPMLAPATAAYRTAAIASPATTGLSSPFYAPASPTMTVSSAAGAGGGAGPGTGTASHPSAPTAVAPGPEPRSGMPPIVYLEVGRIEWGTTPPFIEIVAFENAVEGPPGRTRQQQQQHVHQQYGGRGPAPDTRGTSPFTVSHATSMDTMMTAPATAGAEHGGPLLRPSGGAGYGDATSEGSHGLASRAPTAASTPRIVGGSHSHFDVASASVCGAGPAVAAAGAASPPHPVTTPEPADPLVSILGPGGLHVRLHMTYGGAMHIALNIAVQHELRLGAVALRVSLPMMFYLANLDLDCYVCVNLRHGACEVWLEPGPLSPCVVNRLSLTATIGGDVAEDGSDSDGGHRTGDYGASSTDFYSRFGSSSLSEDEAGEDGNGVYVNEHEVSQFVLHELRAILRETLVAPHSIRVPVSFGTPAS